MSMLIPDAPDELLLNPNLGLVPDIDGPLFGVRAICGNLANHMCPGNMVMRLLKDGLALLKSMKHVHDLSMASNTGKKACGICGKAKPLGQFHWLKTTKSYHSYCKPCLAIYMRRRARRKAKETKPSLTRNIITSGNTFTPTANPAARSMPDGATLRPGVKCKKMSNEFFCCLGTWQAAFAATA